MKDDEKCLDEFWGQVRQELRPKTDSDCRKTKEAWPENWFAQFWAAYPRRVAKKTAFKALEKVRRNEEVEFNSLIAAVKAFAALVRGKDAEFIPHPATWINAGRWEDELPSPQSDTSWRVSAAVEQTLRRRMQ